ncbi:MAG: sulfotransferase [Halobacteriota archaeon]
MPMFTDVAPRIKAFSPEAPILYLLRNPLQRAISHYWWEVNAARETLEINDALRPDSIYLKVSDYAYQLMPYIACFGMERVRLVTTEALASSPERVMNGIFAWLGVDPQFRGIPLTVRYNMTNDVIRTYPDWVVRTGVLTLGSVVLAKNASPQWAKSAFKSVARSKMYEPRKMPLTSARRTIQPLIEQQVHKLTRLTGGQTFPEWHQFNGISGVDIYGQPA